MGAAEAGVAGYIARWQPSSVPPGAARFARAVVMVAAPGGRERAKNLLQSAGRLAGYGIGLGLEPVPEVLLHPPVTGRFTAHGPGLSGPARRTLRTSLRFIAGKVVPQLVPADTPGVSDSLCAGISTTRYQTFIRYLSLALSEVLLPGLFSGFPEPVIPCPAWADAACSYFPGGSGTSAA
jgi:hypothetical protein